MKHSEIKLSTLLIVTILFMKCSNDSNNTNKKIESSVSTEIKASENQTHEFSVSVIEVDKNQFGYDILIDGEPYIHQPHIPAVGGVSGFSSKEKAEIAGNYIIQKLNNNIIPPTISLDELDSLGVLH